MPSNRVLGVAVLLVALAVVPAVAVTSSGPEPLCTVCGDQFEQAANDRGAHITVTGSTATLDVDRNGTGRWTVHVSVLPADAERLATNRSLLEGTVAEATKYEDGLRDSRVHVRNGTVVVEYVEDDVAYRAVGGTLLVDEFHDWDQRQVEFNLDGFVLTGPEGTVVTNDPHGAPGPGDESARWGPDGGAAGFSDETLVAFGSGDGLGARLAALASVGLLVGPRLLKDVLVFATLPTALLAAGVVSTGYTDRFQDWSVDRTAGLAALAAISGGWAVWEVVQSSRVLSVPVGVLLFLSVPALASVAADRLTRARTGGFVAAVILFLGLQFRNEGGWWYTVPEDWQVLFVVPPFLWFALGRFWDRGGPVRLLLAGLVVGTPALLVASAVPVSGFEILLAPVLVGWAFATLLVGLPFGLLGRVVARRRRTHDASDG